MLVSKVLGRVRDREANVGLGVKVQGGPEKGPEG